MADGINTSPDFGQKGLQSRADAIEELGYVPLEADPHDVVAGVRAETGAEPAPTEEEEPDGSANEE